MLDENTLEAEDVPAPLRLDIDRATAVADWLASFEELDEISAALAVRNEVFRDAIAARDLESAYFQLHEMRLLLKFLCASFRINFLPPRGVSDD